MIAVGISLLIITFLLIKPDIEDSKLLPRIAHAGGGYSGKVYSNSIDALNYNKDKYQLFEMDFSFTSDGYLVCLHDWKKYFVKKFDYDDELPAKLSEFELLVKESKKYKNCTFKTLTNWLDENPNKIIVTDVKGDNIRVLSYIASNYPKFSERFIPQIYQVEEYQLVKDMGYDKIIWTLYLFSGSSNSVLKQAKKMDLYAITMPFNRVFKGLAIKLKKNLGIPLYTHTINHQVVYLFYKYLGIDEIYTDWLVEYEQIPEND